MKKPSIGLILPTVEVARRAREVAKELGLQEKVACRVGNHQEGLEMARRLEKEGAIVLASRRSTADLIRENLRTPNISIRLTMQDIAKALADARRVTGRTRPCIGLFAMASDQPDIESFAQLLNFDMRIYTVTPDEEYLALMVGRAIADKIDVIAAGTVVTAMADRQNFPSILLDCGTVALRNVLLEADKVAYARQIEKLSAEYFRIVVEKSHNGILVLDSRHCIQVANPAALDMLGMDAVPPATRLEEILPELKLKEHSTNLEPVRGMFITTSKGALVVDISSTKVSESVDGLVIIFQRAETLSEIGTTTKRNLYSQRFASQYDFSNIIGESPVILASKQKARDYAESNGPVLIAGETGTGKELFAHAIHSASRCRVGPFVPVNCAALPSSLLESELFGYEEGAFTGATRKGKPGLFEMAHQGTIFLDEISELSRSSQIRLLRVVQERHVMRLGGTKIIPLDIRIISATNKNLWELVKKEKFREDLYYRLCVLPLFLPPLRDREGDVALLATHYLKQVAATPAQQGRVRLRKETLRLLERYSWPGNVRELHNVLDRLVASSRKDANQKEQVQRFLTHEQGWTDIMTPARLHPGIPPDKQSEREAIVRTLEECGGHRGNASRRLGINRSTLFRKMSAYGISAFSR